MASTAFPSVASPPEARGGSAPLEFHVEPFAPARLPMVAAFCERYFRRPRTRAYYEWRYLESQPFSRLCLALTADDCLGMVAAFRKTYSIAGQTVPCLETFDWHSLPGLKGSGVGLRVMRAMTRGGERVIAIGGTADVLKTLPAMGWQRIAAVRSYELPLSGAALVDGFRRRVAAHLPGDRRMLDAVARWFRPRRRSVRGEMIPVASLGAEVMALYRDRPAAYDGVQVPDANYLRWLAAGYPSTGSFAFLYFVDGSTLLGWAATRTYDGPAGREAAILDLYASPAGAETYTWMVSEAACWLEAGQPRVIRARASCRLLQAALAANRFRPAAEVPVHTWPANLPADLRWHFTLNHTDEPLRPYPESGFFAPELARD
jgi:hypothetical protein